MQTISLPIGFGYQSAQIDDTAVVQLLDRPVSDEKNDLAALLEEAMDNPIGSDRLEKIVKPSDTVAIVVNDHTRPGPTILILEAIIRRLAAAGISDQQISIVFATGTHRRPTREEAIAILGEEYYTRFHLVYHDCLNEAELVFMGHSPVNRLPIYINKTVAEADVCIATGLIAPHHIAGFSGGRKSIVPGVAGFKSIRIHHSFPIFQYQPALGFMQGNPFHEVAVEAARVVNVKFMVNAVQDPHKNFFAFVAGDIVEAHEYGASLCKEACFATLPKYADVAVVSPGGYPRDIDLHQSQKALALAETVCKPECAFILCAGCSGGFGDPIEVNFRAQLEGGESPQAIIDSFAADGFTIGNNKAFNYARALLRGRIIVVTDGLTEEELRRAKLEWAPNLQAAVDMVMEKERPKIITVIPYAANYIISVDENSNDSNITQAINQFEKEKEQ